MYPYPRLLQPHANANANAKKHHATRLPVAMHLIEQDIRASRALEPLNIIDIASPNKLARQQLPRRAREGRNRRESLRPGRLATQLRRHAPNILIPQISTRPRRRARRGRR